MRGRSRAGKFRWGPPSQGGTSDDLDSPEARTSSGSAGTSRRYRGAGPGRGRAGDPGAHQRRHVHADDPAQQRWGVEAASQRGPRLPGRGPVRGPDEGDPGRRRKRRLRGGHPHLGRQLPGLPGTERLAGPRRCPVRLDRAQRPVRRHGPGQPRLRPGPGGDRPIHRGVRPGRDVPVGQRRLLRRARAASAGRLRRAGRQHRRGDRRPAGRRDRGGHAPASQHLDAAQRGDLRRPGRGAGRGRVADRSRGRQDHPGQPPPGRVRGGRAGGRPGRRGRGHRRRRRRPPAQRGRHLHARRRAGRPLPDAGGRLHRHRRAGDHRSRRLPLHRRADRHLRRRRQHRQPFGPLRRSRASR